MSYPQACPCENRDERRWKGKCYDGEIENA